MFKTHILSFCLAVLVLSGCATTSPRESAPSEAMAPEVREVHRLLDEGKTVEAMVLGVTVARANPRAAGLDELQDRILATRIAERARGTAARETLSRARAIQEANDKGLVPGSYGQRRIIHGANGLVRVAPTRMRQELKKPVTVHLENANLAAFIRQISESEGINIIADASLGATAVTLHAEETPLAEILDYIERHMNIAFSVGENIIWASAAQQAKGPIPLETRVYRLLYGLAGTEIIPPRPTAKADEPYIAQPDPALLDTIKRFVPQPEGAELFYNAKTHALIVRNTRANLALAEDIIAALDVAPPQVLIEARFMAIGVRDLSELGVDWIFGERSVVDRRRNTLQIGNEKYPSTVNFDIAKNIADGISRGASFSLSGILDSTSFQAILHLLESSSKTKTLAIPRVTTVNNRPANIRVGHDFRFFEEFKLENNTYQEFNPRGGDGIVTSQRSRIVPVGKPTVEHLGIELSVTPSVGADNSTIALRLIPEKSEYISDDAQFVRKIDNLSQVYEFIAETTTDENKVETYRVPMPLPVFRRDRIETEVVVQSGETVVMGGLIRTTKRKVEEKVPILGDIPLLGFLFRNETDVEDQENLIIFVTATLIADTGEEL
ncbi:MAG: hypothetical protein FWF84_07750, partial [Kiritimatiellaeota bacterium]|nr:hypothetical protein [Kiritimatiellota bacterium]